MVYFQDWEGENFVYECKSRMLFQIDENTGIRYKKAECKSLGMIQPWWSISKMGGLCKSGLREGTYVCINVENKVFNPIAIFD